MANPKQNQEISEKTMINPYGEIHNISADMNGKSKVDKSYFIIAAKIEVFQGNFITVKELVINASKESSPR